MGVATIGFTLKGLDQAKVGLKRCRVVVCRQDRVRAVERGRR